MKIWSCKIGEVDSLPDEYVEHHAERDIHMSTDQYMRRAVEEAYRQLVGDAPEFIFSGWGGELTPGERATVDGVMPIVEAATWYQARCAGCMDPCDLDGGEWRATPEEAIAVVLDEGGWKRVDEHTLHCLDCQAVAQEVSADERTE